MSRQTFSPDIMYTDEYYRQVRREVTAFIHKGDHAVMELGCGLGATLTFLKREGYARTVFGVDINPELRSRQGTELDEILVCDLEQFDPSVIGRQFDVILLTDVLEHLRQPESLLRKAITLLNGSGYLIVSLPTVRNWNVLYKLLVRGEFSYQDSGGILDRGHLRFFTLKSMHSLFASVGLEITAQTHNVDCHWLARLLVRLPWIGEMGIVQYLFQLKPKPSLPSA